MSGTALPTGVVGFWTLARLAEALDDVLVRIAPSGERALRAITTDTRAIEPGDCFVALRGEKFDAHDFLDEAVSKGAMALVVDDASKAGGLGVPVFLVKDTLVALGRLARFRRRVWGTSGKRVVAVAGSNGKTSTKELLAAALGSSLRVHATTGNLNNRVGVPLTLLALPDDADVAVVEMGTNMPGEVAILRAIGEPDLAVITSIGEEHLEGLGDLAGVLEEESAIADGTPLVVTAAAQPEIARAVRGRAGEVIEAGIDRGDVVPDRWSMRADGSGHLTFRGVDCAVPLLGAHNLANAMLALAVAERLYVPVEAAIRGIERMPRPNMRLALETLGGMRLINDAYNANPASARAALDVLDAMEGGGPRVAVLGTMRELGASAAAMHDDVARRALRSTATVIAGVGEMADALARVAPDDPRVIGAPDPEALWPLLRERLTPDAVVLLKASRGVRLERIVPMLKEWTGHRP